MTGFVRWELYVPHFGHNSYRKHYQWKLVFLALIWAQYSGCGVLCIILFEYALYFALLLRAVAAWKVVISHPGPGSWLC